MPNWCMTNITIICENKEAAKELYRKIKTWTSTEYCKSDFGNNWLENIVGNSGIDKRAKEDGHGIDFAVKCRGSLTYIDTRDNHVIVETETAWKPMLKMWVMVCDKYLGKGKYKLLYSAEEPLCNLYVTNDPDYVNTYDIYVEDVLETKTLCDIIGRDSLLDAPESEFISILQEYFKTKENDICVLLKKFLQNPILKYVDVRKCVYADVNYWE